MRTLIQPGRAAAIALIALCVLTSPVAGSIKLKKDAERKHAPVFQLKNAEGKTVQLSDFAGRVVLLDFWATWCAPCKSSISWMIELSEKYRSAGLTVVGISMDEDGWAVVGPFMDELKINYPILLGDKRVAYLYGDVEALPVAFFVDRNQRVAAIHAGPATLKEFEKTIKALLDSPK
ncbi:MAG: TlpA family protein disulfide reductase [Bryobacteraceae bacterium]